MKKILWTIGLILSIQWAYATTHYVVENGSGTGAGTSWANAFAFVDWALAIASPGDIILVADGYYYPTIGTGRNKSFVIPNGVKVYGGFPKTPNPTDGINDRNTFLYRPVLSGNINDADEFDNCYHVVKIIGATSETVLEGFVVKDGYANGSGFDDLGAGIYLKNVPKLTIENCEIEYNFSASHGAGIYHGSDASTSPKIINCKFDKNSGNGEGAGFYNDILTGAIVSTVQLTGCLFTNNQSWIGGAISSNAVSGTSSMTLLNCTITKNKAQNAGALSVSTDALSSVTNSVFIQNSIIWANEAFSTSNADEVVAFNGGNITFGKFNILNAAIGAIVANSGSTISTSQVLYPNLDPLLDASTFVPALASRALETGESSGSTAMLQKDVLGNNRLAGDQIDLGAIEFKYDAYMPKSTIYVDHMSSGITAAQSGFVNTYNKLEEALNVARAYPSTVNQIWVAKGTYIPSAIGDEEARFFLVKKGVHIKGGFPNAKSNPTLADFDWRTNITTLSADLGSSKDVEELLVLDTLVNDMVLEGVHVTGVKEKLALNIDECLAKLEIKNSKFHNNDYERAGLIRILNSSASKDGTVVVSNSEFINNDFNWQTEGAILKFITTGDSEIRATLQNCLFANNEIGGAGAIAAHKFFSSNGATHIVIENCTFSGNTFESTTTTVNKAYIASNSGGTSGTQPSLELRNCIEYNHTLGANETLLNVEKAALSVYTASLGVATETKLLKSDGVYVIAQIVYNQDPKFVGSGVHPYALQFDSPCYDTGNPAKYNTSLSSCSAYDLAGNERTFDARIDMGAYEYSLPCPSTTTIFVKKTASGANDGTSWTDAYTDLRLALLVAKKCTNVNQVWVASDTYFTNKNRKEDSFEIPNNVWVLGGFPNTGNPSSGDRDWEANPTILSGDIGTVGTHTDNLYHVVYNNGSNANTRFDGFVIQHGNAFGSDFTDQIGAGMLIEDSDGVGSLMQVFNCTFRENTAESLGGGVAMYSNGGTVVNAGLNYCIFENNSADVSGGGLVVYARGAASKPTVQYCTFKNNEAKSLDGGAVEAIGLASASIDLKLTNSIFYKNKAFVNGGAISFKLDASVADIGTQINHCTFHQNTAGNFGGALFSDNTNGVIETYVDNSIIWGNSAANHRIHFQTDSNIEFNYSIVDEEDCSKLQASGSGTFMVTCSNNNKFGEDPRFVDGSTGDLKLKFCSPAIDAADPSNFAADDFDNLSRPVSLYADIGAYEFNAKADMGLFQTATPGAGVNKLNANWEFTDNSGWTHFCNCDTEQLLLSLKKNGNNIGTISGGLVVEIGLDEDYSQGVGKDLAGAAYNSYPLWFVMNRFWNVDPVAQPSTPVSVRYYFDSDDVGDVSGSVLGAAGNFSSYKDLIFYKADFNPDPHDPSIPSSDFHPYSYTNSTASLSNWTDGMQSGNQYAEFLVSSFSGGSAGGNGSNVPLELLDFTGKKEGNNVVLNWTTSHEVNVDGFVVERSNDGVHFFEAGWVAAKGDDTGAIFKYRFIDPIRENGQFYYRLKQLDLDGSYEYSPIVTIAVRGGKKLFHFFPNPVYSKLNIILSGNIEGKVSLVDGLGRTVWSQDAEPDMRIDVEHLSPGFYSLVLQDNNGEVYMEKLQIVK